MNIHISGTGSYIPKIVKKNNGFDKNKFFTMQGEPIETPIKTIIDKFKGGPVGITTIATAVSESPETIEEVYEPFLIQQGFIMRTPRGREVTELAYKHLGRQRGDYQKGLF